MDLLVRDWTLFLQYLIQYSWSYVLPNSMKKWLFCCWYFSFHNHEVSLCKEQLVKWSIRSKTGIQHITTISTWSNIPNKFFSSNALLETMIGSGGTISHVPPLPLVKPIDCMVENIWAIMGFMPWQQWVHKGTKMGIGAFIVFTQKWRSQFTIMPLKI